MAETAVALAILTASFRQVVQDNGDINVDGLLTLELTADSSRYAASTRFQV